MTSRRPRAPTTDCVPSAAYLVGPGTLWGDLSRDRKGCDSCISPPPAFGVLHPRVPWYPGCMAKARTEGLVRRVRSEFASLAEWDAWVNAHCAAAREDDTPVLMGQTGGSRKRATGVELMALIEEQRARYAAPAPAFPRQRERSGRAAAEYAGPARCARAPPGVVPGVELALAVDDHADRGAAGGELAVYPGGWHGSASDLLVEFYPVGSWPASLRVGSSVSLFWRALSCWVAWRFARGRRRGRRARGHGAAGGRRCAVLAVRAGAADAGDRLSCGLGG